MERGQSARGFGSGQACGFDGSERYCRLEPFDLSFGSVFRPIAIRERRRCPGVFFQKGSVTHEDAMPKPSQRKRENGAVDAADEGRAIQQRVDAIDRSRGTKRSEGSAMQ